MKGEKLLPTSKVPTEEFEAWKSKRKNCKREFKVRLKEVTTTKPCSERSTSKEKTREERLWSVKNKPWESYKLWLVKGNNWRDFSKTTNSKRKKTKTTSEEWSIKSLKRKENWQVSLRNLPEKVISTNKNYFSWNSKLTKKEENHWLTSKRFKSFNKFLILVANKLRIKSECWPNNLKRKGEKVWLTKKELKIFKELLMRRFTSWMN